MRFFLGFVFLIIGVVGIILPVIPGIPFFIVSAFLFGLISKEKVIKYMKKFKNGNKDSIWNRIINYVLIKYIHGKEPLNLNGKS